ncbi:hypothetical protein [Anaerosinus massiliensis]|uniref:hypothetical protein n=1 Tax=Massilibacillus massiliensis TaxID=1806837 RepID=UPI000DA62E76|nr:hypothetical protein [Massilibacillus massiliensis]
MSNFYDEYFGSYTGEYVSIEELNAMIDDLEAKLSPLEDYYTEHKPTIDYLRKWVVDSTKVSWTSCGVLLQYYYGLSNNPAQAFLTIHMATAMIGAGVILMPNFTPTSSNDSWSDFLKENDTNTYDGQ